MRQTSDAFKIFNAKAATGTGVSFNASDYEHIVISVATASSANFTIKFQGAISDEAPTFSDAQSVANMWDYVEVIDLQSGSAIDGDTGVSAAGTDDFRLFEVNTNGLKWVNATLTAYAAGAITVVAKGFSA
jgi:hypothetical protein